MYIPNISMHSEKVGAQGYDHRNYAETENGTEHGVNGLNVNIGGIIDRVGNLKRDIPVPEEIHFILRTLTPTVPHTCITVIIGRNHPCRIALRSTRI